MHRILLGDDNEVLRGAVKTILCRQSGWDVCGEATSGLEAARLAKQLRPDVVILDLRMPGMNGLMAAKEILTIHPAMPIILYSLDIDNVLESYARSLGVRKIISKSDILASLVDNLTEILATSSTAS